MEEELRAWVRSARHIAVLSGAGMSAESGVPTFRDALTALWARFDPKDLATEAAFRRRPELVWDWYAERRSALDRVEPNAGHRALADFQLRHPGRLTLVTQNVDGLHQRAGSTGVLALHGELAQDRWLQAPRPCCREDHLLAGRPPHCPVCGNLRRPGVVWFGEALPQAALSQAQAAAEACDLMLVVGTSGEVYPAAGLAVLAGRTGSRVLIVNPEATALDQVATHCLRETAAAALPWLLGAD
jgi:NAD-dependent deacetylase